MTEPKALRVGSVWEIESEERVTITRPDGSTSVVAPTEGVALYVPQSSGTYTAEADGKTIEVDVK